MLRYTDEVCLPQIVKLQQLQQKKNKKQSMDDNVFLSIDSLDDQDIIPYTCFFTALSFLKRLPTQDEIQDKNQMIDLELGYQMKQSFIELSEDHKTNETRCT